MQLRMPRATGGNMGRTKNIIHFVQAFVIFIAWAMTIAVWTKGDGIDGRTVWYWLLCWISIPALIYLAAVPMWPRARRFGNVYAFATVDMLWAVFWFSAWVGVASYVAQGKSIGKSSDNSKNNATKKTGCDNWAYGSASKCNVSTGITIVGVIIFVLFAVTSWMSLRNVMHFRRTGTLPDAVSDPTFAAQSKAAFSSNPAHDFEEDEDDFRSGRSGLGMPSASDRDEDYALLQQSEVDDIGNAHGRSAMHGAYDPTGPTTSSVLHDYNSTGYGGAHGQHYAPPSEFGASTSGYGR
ncbi:Uncharacterized protein PECH_003866 [Penicillium ucsense]|uniref:MARVEL domain-containing protein n=1 Tax=Penicillium ucsense TaxID=2839758 RepID=A0A8J8W3Z5_9EURO|nr:Uncharacterized protein PECM_005633 [Penicillium ucsense]KAF7737414.1 Uncharacterized protein PECH_003866 [Penicillium ucsense]